MPEHRALFYNFNSGEISVLPASEILSADSFSYIVRYIAPSIEWVIPHQLGVYLPEISYKIIGKGGIPHYAGVDETKSDAFQTTLHLTEAVEGVLQYQILEGAAV
jgi:hypothetical protein